MLDVALRNVSYAYPKSTFALREISLTFPGSTHTAIVGPAGSGASTLLRLIAGELRPQSGEVQIGARVVNTLATSRRPLLYATSEVDAPGRWSVRHLLIAAVRQRTLDRPDRQAELDLALSHWKLTSLVDRALGTLSSTERTLAQLARIELMRPAILVADRILESANPSLAAWLADEFYRTLRVAGTTVIVAPSSLVELGATGNVVVLDGGRVAQEGVPSQVFANPISEASALATGGVTVIPITIRGSVVESVIGAWEIASPPFQGNGIALARPDDFTIAAHGEESDLIFGVEEASSYGGAWHVRGFLSGGLVLRVTLPRDAPIHKGRLIALRYDPSRFRLLASDAARPDAGVPTDVLPLMRDSR